MNSLLNRIPAANLLRKKRLSIDAETLAQAAHIVEAVRIGGISEVRRFAERYEEVGKSDSLIIERNDLRQAWGMLSSSERDVLQRTKERIELFARAQRGCLSELSLSLPSGKAGHRISPLEHAGCYAPGGRYPLPSSVLMTVVPAVVAGVADIVVASPRPTLITQGAAYIAGARCLLRVGGAHAIAALAYGIDNIAPRDIIVGPGNRWVTAAKKFVSGDVAIDMLAGPSELLIIADTTASPAIVAADLLAQAEHDPDAVPMLLTQNEALVSHVEEELRKQLSTLPTADTARQALQNGFVCVCGDIQEIIRLANVLAAEHLELLVQEPATFVSHLSNYGALFEGSLSAEVFGDYGAGPNHVLPTGGTARFVGGLSVLNFLRVSTFLRIDAAADEHLVQDAIALARMEGLEAHARAAEMRQRK